MTPTDEILWQKISGFVLDDPGALFTFSDRLARENGWTKAYALRVVEEYRRFLFLCCITDAGVTPSDPVDQAWHLHLTYTRSYWVDLCRNTLQKEIHHNPTKGGETEAGKFKGFYTSLHQLYKATFGTPPPPDIWQDQHTRFSDIHFQRVNLRKNWILRKPMLPRKNILVALGCVVVALLFIQAIRWDLPNILFLGFLLVVCVAVYKNRGKGGERSAGCTTSSCGFDGGSGCGNHGNSGCSSGCSGCSNSGCSGCSGCGGGD